MKHAAIFFLCMCVNAHGMESLDDNDLSSKSAIEENKPTAGRGTYQDTITSCKMLEPSAEMTNFNHRSAKHHTDAQLRKIMGKNAGLIHAKYQSALWKNPCLAGMIIFTITLSPSGFPSEIQHKSEGEEMQLIAKDIASALMKVNFGPADQEDLFDYSINLHPR